MKTPDYKIKTTHTNDGDFLDVVMEGDLSFKNAAGILKTLRSLKTNCRMVNLKLKNVARLDITTLQTVRVFEDDISKEGKALKVEADLTEEIQRLLRNSGFSSIL